MRNLRLLLRKAVEERLIRPLDMHFAFMVVESARTVASIKPHSSFNQQDGVDSIVNLESSLMLAAAYVSAEVGEGHVCVPLSYFHKRQWLSQHDPFLSDEIWRSVALTEDWDSLLRLSTAVSDGSTPTPLVIAQGRLYLQRMWQAEQCVAAFIKARIDMPIVFFSTPLEIEKVNHVLNEFFDDKPNSYQKENDQKIAAAVALTRSISIISGGPGTGKTTTVAKLLASFIRLTPGVLRIRLVAPTGKAAARLTQSLSKARQALSLTELERERFPREATTVHRLLTLHANSQYSRYQTHNPLPIDVLVIDEASMIDLPMMARLIESLPKNVKMILLGDRDQLASVEAGSFFGDICSAAEFGYSEKRSAELTRLTGFSVTASPHSERPEIRDNICLLNGNYRFSLHSGIGQLARIVNAGEVLEAQKLLCAHLDDIHYVDYRAQVNSVKSLNNSSDCDVGEGDGGEKMIEKHLVDQIVQGYEPYLERVKEKASPREILEAFAHYRLLCALRDGPYGVRGLNSAIEKNLMKRWLFIQQNEVLYCTKNNWYNGRPVMILRNDNALGLFNGDTGIALEDQGRLRVFFLFADGAVRSIDPSRLPPHETTWAMTVHKSQGAEFDHAALLLPHYYSPVLTRELLYTAMTRARRRLTLYSSLHIFGRAMSVRTERRSGLMALLDIE